MKTRVLNSVIFSLLFTALFASAAEPTVASEPAVTVRRAEPVKAASWLDHYTLGPGDVLDFGLYGRPDLRREKLIIQPDGTISYLQATNIRAEGMTIDQLRTQMDGVFGEFYKHPRVLIAPVELRSKKYFVVGKAVENGAYIMDRPTTLIEAIARARGLETGLVEHRYAELADLSRSFVLRDGKRLSINLEALFMKGDLSQNVQVEPNDYIYIALSRTSDIYLYGDVLRPGVQAYSPRLTVMATVTARGGFTRSAWREKVLVVRGSLTEPQVISVNTNDILKGKARDFELMPNDIVYVNSRPWLVADQILDAALGAFFQGATSGWTGRNIPAMITSPLLPQINNANTAR